MFGGYLEQDEYVGHKMVCMDADYKPDRRNCTVLSFGMKKDWTFDEAMAHYGCKVRRTIPTEFLLNNKSS